MGSNQLLLHQSSLLLRSCTFARVALVPLFVFLWHTAHDYASIATASVFILAALTDWLDGYLARRVGIVLKICCVRALFSCVSGCGVGLCAGAQGCRIALRGPAVCAALAELPAGSVASSCAHS